jgi:5-methylthioadenosine/S-adenosylhomocysteine deaminase
MANPRRLLLTGGTLVTMDRSLGDLRRADLLIEDDRIAEIAPHVEVEECVVLDASGMIVMPGLVDAHRHLWYSAIRGLAMDATLNEMVVSMWPALAAQYTPEDLYAATRAGALDALEHGITTVLDWCHVINSPEHGPEAVRALREVPIRAVFAYGASMDRKLDEYAGQTEHDDSWEPARALRRNELSADSGLLRMALALQGPEFTTLEISRRDIEVARQLGLPMTMHCGIPTGAPSRRTIAQLAEAGLLREDMQFVHCCATADEEFVSLAAAGGVAVACPMAELGMGMGQPPVGRMRDAGLRPAVGADAVCTASGDQFDEARTALFSERGRHARAITGQGRPVENPSQLGLTAREALEAITIGGARACWLEDRVGSLTPGKQADVIMFSATDLNLSPLSDVIGMLVCSAHGRDVDTVIVAGEIVKRDGRIVGVDERSVHDGLLATRDRLFASQGYPGMVPA